MQSINQRRSVLIVSDDLSLRESLTHKLHAAFCVYTAEDTERAFCLLSENYQDISVVIFDIQKPRRDGAAFLQMLHKKPLLLTAPIIMITDCPDEAEEESLLKLGACDYIAKPIQEKLLFSLIRNLIRIQDTAITLSRMEKDDMTGCYNLQAFQHHAQALLDADPDGDYDLAITDIDKFKLVNAVYGEEKANEVLKCLADYLNANFGEILFGRYGSDLFIWLQKSKPDCGVEIEKKLTQFREISPIADIMVRCGIYSHVDRSVSMIRMCDKAILALKSIKTRFGKITAYYDGPVSRQHLREQMYAARFPEALKNEEFVVWFQPKYDPVTQKVVGAEALVRWKNADGSFNMPGEFLSVFESNGMISQLDEYVFRMVCRQQKKWQDAGVPLFPVSVNLSRNSMHKKDLAANYSAIAREYGINPKYIPIEITETTATGSMEIQKYAEELHQAGFPLHMDDFGSERSSLQTLNVLNFDVVKLDKGLVDFIGDEAGEMVLTYTMALAAELGLRIVAEGVETKQQLDFLSQNGCDQIQGYYFSRPLPLDEFERKTTDNLGTPETDRPRKENLFTLSLTSHFEKLMTQRMLPRIPGGFLIYEASETEHIIYSNAYLWKLFGCTDEEDFMNCVGGSFMGVVAPEQRQRVHESIQRQIGRSSEELDWVEYDIVRKDGVRVPVVDYGHLEHVGKNDLFYVFIYKKTVKEL